MVSVSSEIVPNNKKNFNNCYQSNIERSYSTSVAIDCRQHTVYSWISENIKLRREGAARAELLNNMLHVYYDDKTSI